MRDFQKLMKELEKDASQIDRVTTPFFKDELEHNKDYFEAW
jgi:hypothetical protein